MHACVRVCVKAVLPIELTKLGNPG
jgi:hypothetical protein